MCIANWIECYGALKVEAVSQPSPKGEQGLPVPGLLPDPSPGAGGRAASII